MNQDLFDWILLFARWIHITVAVTWIGTSIFFMWLDRTFTPNPESKRPGHVGEVWMVHGGGFYHVEKLLMGPTKVPEHLHWFKWESYWTWMSGFFLVAMIFYTGDGSFLLDASVSDLSYWQAVGLGLFSIFGSWFFYDFVWEREIVRERPGLGHVLTLAWFAGMSYLLLHTISGRAAYIHVGGMLGTWMTANVFMRIIPRQVKMVEAAKLGQAVDPTWGKNAKNRSTHNTYFTLPVIFIMLSNHFPSTYGSEYPWVILLAVSAGGAAIREYFVVRLSRPARSKLFGGIGVALLLGVALSTSLGSSEQPAEQVAAPAPEQAVATPPPVTEPIPAVTVEETHEPSFTGVVHFAGPVPKRERLNLPAGCGAKGDEVFSNQILVNKGKLQNVLVRVTQGVPTGRYPVPTTPVVLDQKHCQYSPRVVGVRAGQPVEFINSDPIFHNVRSVTGQNQRFNMAMPKQDQRETKIFTNPELFLQAKCSVHPWMGAYVAVLEHPFFAVTDAQGRYLIPKLPPGTYTLEAWHEIFGTQTKTVTVSDQAVAPPTDFTFKGTP